MVDTKGHKDTPEETAEARRDKDHAGFIDRWTLRFAGANTVLPTGLLMVVGIGGICLAVSSLKKLEEQGTMMKRQADLMERQVRVMESQTALMQIPYRQWIVIADWKVNFTPKSDPVKKLTITANLINQTEFPMKISNGKIIFGDAFGDPGTTSQTPWEIRGDCFLPPAARHPIEVTLDLDQQEALEFTHGIFRIHVRGQFYHIGPLGDRLKTSLLGVLACGRWGIQYQPIVHMTPRAEEDQNENPN